MILSFWYAKALDVQGRRTAWVNAWGSLGWNESSASCGSSISWMLVRNVWRWSSRTGHEAIKCTVSSSSSLQSWHVLFVVPLILQSRDWVRYVWVASWERIIMACRRNLEELAEGYRSWAALMFWRKNDKEDFVSSAATIFSWRVAPMFCLVFSFHLLYGMGLLTSWRHVLARCTQHMDTAAMYTVRTLNASGRCGFSVD